MDEQVHPIHDKTPKIPGFTSSRSVIIGGLAVVGILVVALSNFSSPTVKKSTAPTATTSTPAQIRQFTEDLHRQASEYAKEKERADALKAQAQSMVAAQQAMPVAASSAGPVNYAAPPVDVKRRSNIAFSFREGAQPVASKLDTPESQLADIRGLIDSEKSALAANIAASQRLATPNPTPPPAPVAEPTGGLQTFASTGKTYKLFEGDVIETVLTNRLNGSFTGPVNVMVTTAVYSHDHQHVLIPQGSRIIGEAERVGTQGQQRLAVVFHRVICPDGYSMDLNKFTGLNAVGETGLKDKTDNHWGTIAASAVALGVVQGFSLSGTGSAFTSNGLGEYRQGLANATSQSGTQILSRQLSILPTITIMEGHRVRVWLNKDVDLPAVENHRVPGDI